ncbi:hypothetical protein [Actinomyces sp. HMSC065F12]|uniref:hypothetical protein n=1 Tax=Actinomyces sp. HMSC065F12 TaxID=1739479 RepID=UPI0008A559BC|nr:hypothetical protein [Actinomyces sp. HMSC065F12]OFP69585.1 hypothetical protein HMPREF2975_03605 [Actinomyces sp. HMSC065F12]
MSNVQFSVPFTEFMPSALSAISAVSNDKSVPMLASVLFTVHDGKAAFIATDRYEAIIATLPSVSADCVEALKGSPVLIDGSAFKKGIKSIRIKRSEFANSVMHWSFNLESDTPTMYCRVENDDAILGHAAIELGGFFDQGNSYPPVAKLFEDRVTSKARENLSINADLLKFLSEVGKCVRDYVPSASSRKAFPVTILAGEQCKPHMFIAGENVAGLVMPVRVDDNLNGNSVLASFGGVPSEPRKSAPKSESKQASKAKAVAPVAADSVPTDSTAIDKTLSTSAKALRKFLYRTFRAKNMHVYREFETNAVRIAWTGGPTLEEVAKVAKRFTVGHDGHAIRSFKLERA